MSSNPYEPLPEREIKSILSSHSAVVAKFGADFAKGDYGWAALHLRKVWPTFKDIEHAVGIDHLRGHFRFASHNVHANPKGAFFKLGLLAESQIHLAGPSNAGLMDPGQLTALSLTQVSAALNRLQPTLDNTITLQMLAQLVKEIARSFDRPRKRVAGDAERLRSRPNKK